MKLVVLRERGSTVALVFLVVFILLFALPFVYTLRRGWSLYWAFSSSSL